MFEVPELEAPILIDPTLLGLLYVGIGSVLLDPFTGLDQTSLASEAR